MKLTFLGTGTSFGVPQLGCGCAVCRSPDPRDKRTRVGAVVETDGGTRLLIDTPPELRLQLIAAGIDRVDAVLFTHDHADHTHGIDDLRAITARRDAHSADVRRQRDAGRAGARSSTTSSTTASGRCRARRSRRDARIASGAGRADSHRRHRRDRRSGAARAVSRSSRIASDRSPTSPTPSRCRRERDRAAARRARARDQRALSRPHPSHLSFPRRSTRRAQIGAERTYLTHLTHDNFHADLEAELPRGIAPAFDGLTVPRLTIRRTMTIRLDYTNMMAPPIDGGIIGGATGRRAPRRSQGRTTAFGERARGRDARLPRPARRSRAAPADARLRARVTASGSTRPTSSCSASAARRSGPIALRTALLRAAVELCSTTRRAAAIRACTCSTTSIPPTITALLDRLDLRRALFVVISKSGGTAETMAQYLVVRDAAERSARRREGASVSCSSPIRRRARCARSRNAEGIPALDIPPNVGGRFSVLTPVGILPAALIGHRHGAAARRRAPTCARACASSDASAKNIAGHRSPRFSSSPTRSTAGTSTC